jgi:hypothetical protein
MFVDKPDDDGRTAFSLPALSLSLSLFLSSANRLKSSKPEVEFVSFLYICFDSLLICRTNPHFRLSFTRSKADSMTHSRTVSLSLSSIKSINKNRQIIKILQTTPLSRRRQSNRNATTTMKRSNQTISWNKDFRCRALLLVNFHRNLSPLRSRIWTLITRKWEFR